MLFFDMYIILLYTLIAVWTVFQVALKETIPNFYSLIPSSLSYSIALNYT